MQSAEGNFFLLGVDKIKWNKEQAQWIESNKPQYLIHENRLTSNLISQENRIEYNIGSLRIELDTVELNRLESHAVYNQIQYKY